jgi:hypothetical protein
MLKLLKIVKSKILDLIYFRNIGKLKKIEQEQTYNSQSFLERLGDHNYKTYKKSLNSRLQDNENKMKHLTNMVLNVPTDEAQKTSQIESMNKLHQYRELKRNRETKATSLFNKMSYRDNKRKIDLTQAKLIPIAPAHIISHCITEGSLQNQTSLLW